MFRELLLICQNENCLHRELVTLANYAALADEGYSCPQCHFIRQVKARQFFVHMRIFKEKRDNFELLTGWQIIGCDTYLSFYMARRPDQDSSIIGDWLGEASLDRETAHPHGNYKIAVLEMSHPQCSTKLIYDEHAILGIPFSPSSQEHLFDKMHCYARFGWYQTHFMLENEDQVPIVKNFIQATVLYNKYWQSLFDYEFLTVYPVCL